MMDLLVRSRLSGLDSAEAEEKRQGQGRARCLELPQLWCRDKLVREHRGVLGSQVNLETEAHCGIPSIRLLRQFGGEEAGAPFWDIGLIGEPKADIAGVHV